MTSILYVICTTSGISNRQFYFVYNSLASLHQFAARCLFWQIVANGIPCRKNDGQTVAVSLLHSMGFTCKAPEDL